MRVFFYLVFAAFFHVGEFIYIVRDFKDEDFNK